MQEWNEDRGLLLPSQLAKQAKTEKLKKKPGEKGKGRGQSVGKGTSRVSLSKAPSVASRPAGGSSSGDDKSVRPASEAGEMEPYAKHMRELDLMKFLEGHKLKDAIGAAQKALGPMKRAEPCGPRTLRLAGRLELFKDAEKLLTGRD